MTRLLGTAIITIIANVLFTGGHFFISTSYQVALVGVNNRWIHFKHFKKLENNRV